MFSKYFSFKYFPNRYFTKGATFNSSYSNTGDVQSALTQDYSNSGDIITACGGTLNYEKAGDIWVTILKRKKQEKIEFGYDVTTEIN